MGLFEILLITVFILFPIIEGINKKRRREQQRQQEGLPERGGPDREPQRFEHETEPWAAEEDAAGEEAADMIPDDLWELLTGERRPARTTRREEPVAFDVEQLESDATYGDEEFTPPGRFEREPEPAPAAPAPEPPPIWLETRTPPTSPIEVPRQEPVPRWSREWTRPPTPRGPTVRLAPTRPPGRAPRIAAMLRGPAALRRAVILSEILGPPKGLQHHVGAHGDSA